MHLIDDKILKCLMWSIVFHRFVVLLMKSLGSRFFFLYKSIFRSFCFACMTSFVPKIGKVLTMELVECKKLCDDKIDFIHAVPMQWQTEKILSWIQEYFSSAIFFFLPHWNVQPTQFFCWFIDKHISASFLPRYAADK